MAQKAEKIQFYPLDITYKVVEGKALIYIFGRLADGTQVCVIDENFEPYFLVLPKNIAEASKILKEFKVVEDDETASVTRVEEKKMRLFGKDIHVLKVYADLPHNVPKLRQEVEKLAFVEKTFEYDIIFTRRYFIDRKIIPMTLTQAEGEFVASSFKTVAFRADKIYPISEDTLANPKVLAFDIETYNPPNAGIDTENNPILMIAVYGNDLHKVMTWKPIRSDKLNIEHVSSESELIERFLETIRSYKPDIITGYYSDGFDLPYIRDRAQKYKIKVDIGLDHSDIKVEKRNETESQITGIVHIDAYKFVKKVLARGLNLDDYTLKTVATELLNETKTEIDITNLHHAWDTNDSKELEQYCVYNLQDALLVYKMFHKIYPHLLEMIKIVGQSPFTINRLSFSQLVEWYLMRQASIYNEITPNKPDHYELNRRLSQSYTGAFVFQPKPGLYKKLVIFDFRSLYPSIISSHNIDIGTLNCEDCSMDENKVHIEESDETYWFCTRKKGFLSALIEDIITRRARIKEIMKEDKDNPMLDARQNSLKLLANAFYGYLGFSQARWYSIECARAVTAFGRYHIKKVIAEAEKAGFTVLYSDTDSVFLALNQKSKQDAIDFLDTINADLPGIMELEYEGYYPAALFVAAKESEIGAKKRYALLGENGKITIKGFEVVRRNFSIIGKEVQEKVLDLVLKDDPEKAADFLRKIIADLRENKIPVEKMIIMTQLTKATKDYDSIGPHVAIAQKMEQKGIHVGPGSNIRYIITKGPGKIRDKAKLPDETSQDEYDPDYYLNNQIIPSVEKIFEVLGFDVQEMLSDKKQKGLGEWFG